MYMYYVSVYEEDVNMLLLALKNNIILFFPLPQHLSDPHYLPTPPPSFMFFLSMAQNSQNQKQTKKQRKTKFILFSKDGQGIHLQTFPPGQPGIPP